MAHIPENITEVERDKKGNLYLFDHKRLQRVVIRPKNGHETPRVMRRRWAAVKSELGANWKVAGVRGDGVRVYRRLKDV